MELSKRNKIVQFALTVMAVILIVCGIFLLDKSSDSTSITIGCPNNIGGMIMNYAIENYCGDIIGIKDDSDVSTYFIADCCAPKTGISLTSGELQGAIMCPDSAKELTDKDKRFIIVNDFTFNTEVLVLSSSVPNIEAVKKIGYMNNQERQKENLELLYGADIEYMPVQAASLPYALELAEVDAAVLDFGTGMYMDNAYTVLTSDKPTTVLVLSREFYDSEQYETLKLAIEQTYEDMEDYDNFVKAMQFINTAPVDRKEFDKWQSLDKKYPRK